MVMYEPLVSVLMTAYNRELFIAEAIESVLQSSFLNFELIIVDDCSQDNTVNIALKFERLDSRIRVFVNDKNLGDYANRNKAASYAIGKYLKYLDSDDVMSSKCLEIMVSGMENNPHCAYGVSSRVINQSLVISPELAYKIHFFERGILDISPSGSIIRNDVFQRENGFRNLRCVGDLELWLRLSLSYSMLEFEKDLIFWRVHDHQEINVGKIAYLEYEYSIIKENIDKSSLTDFERAVIIKRIKRTKLRFILKNYFDLKLSEIIKYWKINELSIFDVW